MKPRRLVITVTSILERSRQAKTKGSKTEPRLIPDKAKTFHLRFPQSWRTKSMIMRYTTSPWSLYLWIMSLTTKKNSQGYLWSTCSPYSLEQYFSSLIWFLNQYEQSSILARVSTCLKSIVCLRIMYRLDRTYANLILYFWVMRDLKSSRSMLTGEFNNQRLMPLS